MSAAKTPVKPTSVQTEETDAAPKSEEKKAKPIWLTRAMAEEFSRRHVLITTFKEALVFLLFVITVSLSTIGRRNSSMFYLTQAIKGQFLKRDFITANGIIIKFEDINSATDFWHYTSGLLMDSFYWEAYYNPNDPVREAKPDDQKILFENKLLGVPRLRQVRMPNDSCKVPSFFKEMFKSCYNKYRETDEEKGPFGPGTGKAWTFSSEAETHSMNVDGQVTEYGGGGYYQDLGTTRNVSLEIIENLRTNLWVSRSTRVIFVDFSVYNANLNLFAICKLVFEFPPTGGIIPSHTFRAVQLIYYVQNWDYITTASEWIVYILALFYLSEELREMIYFRHRYLLQFWSYIDCTVILLAVMNFVISIILFPSVNEHIDKIKMNPNAYGNLEYIGDMKINHNNLAAFLLFFTYIKIFKYLNFNKTMGQLNNTLKRCALDILGFAIMFFIIFIAFAELGYLLFGSQVKDFSSFGIAMFTLLRTILGDFDYNAIHQANPILAPIYFLAYIFLVFFVLLNMFLAIINDTYADVKTEIAIAPDEMQMVEFIKTEIYMFLAKLGFKIQLDEVQKSGINVTISQIRDALKKCGFTDLEIEMFFARYNIDPLAEIGAYDMKTLLNELEANSTTIATAEDTSLVQVNDFIAQQDRLVMIEQAVIKLAMQVDVLIKKLEELDQQRKAKLNK